MPNQLLKFPSQCDRLCCMPSVIIEQRRFLVKHRELFTGMTSKYKNASLGSAYLRHTVYYISCYIDLWWRKFCYMWDHKHHLLRSKHHSVYWDLLLCKGWLRFTLLQSKQLSFEPISLLFRLLLLHGCKRKQFNIWNPNTIYSGVGPIYINRPISVDRFFGVHLWRRPLSFESIKDRTVCCPSP